jgi:hypothetical protein
MSLDRKVHVWIGTTHQSEEEYYKYFELDYSVECIDDPEYIVCPFCKDIGEKWYDEDFLLAAKPMEQEVPLNKLINEVLIEQSEVNKIIDKCNKIGITKANAIFTYAICKYNELTISEESIKESYNGLKYIGLFLE